MMISSRFVQGGCRFGRRTCLHKALPLGNSFRSATVSAPRGCASFVLRHPAVKFDPESVSAQAENQLLGIELKPEDASLVIIPVAWAATTSGGKGTEKAPHEMVEASRSLDAFQADFVGLGLGDPWKFGMSVLPASSQLEAWAAEAEEAADADDIGKVNEISRQMNDWLEARATEHIALGQRVAVLGGDHSTPLGLIRGVGKIVGHFGILHVDAHLDMRPHRDDEFMYGHDKIMYNVLREVPSLSSFVTVGARDFCRAELDVAHNDHRVALYLESTIRGRRGRGETWVSLVKEIVGRLPQQVYLSIDIDGLDPSHCPNTGTPVPGGLSFPDLVELVLEVCRSGRTIVGFDLVEVGSGRLDTITGATLLLKLCSALLHSNGARDATYLPEGATAHSDAIDNGSGYCVPYEVRESPGAGLGVFALRAIPKGALIWRPRCVRRFDKAAAFEHMQNLSQLERDNFTKYVFCFDGTLNFIGDDNRYTNHSDDPTGVAHEGADPFEVYAARDIAEGEELTECYGDWPMMDWVPDLDKAFPTVTEVPFCCMELAKPDFLEKKM